MKAILRSNGISQSMHGFSPSNTLTPQYEVFDDITKTSYIYELVGTDGNPTDRFEVTGYYDFREKKQRERRNGERRGPSVGRRTNSVERRFSVQHSDRRSNKRDRRDWFDRRKDSNDPTSASKSLHVKASPKR